MRTLGPCPCGKPWLNLDLIDPRLWSQVEQFIAELGEYIPVSIGPRTWSVPRRCIAWHGVTSDQLAAGIFEEIPT